jgi:DNA-binding NarL/FixJ family response regulator
MHGGGARDGRATREGGDDLAFRILIADDHSIILGILKTLLETHTDWQVCAEAANGLEAVQKAAEFKPDLIILDLAMPVMDGLQAAREIHSSSPEVPILLHTDHAFSSLALEARKNGVRQIIKKGGSEDQLLRTVEMLLREKLQSTADAQLHTRAKRARQTPSAT